MPKLELPDYVRRIRKNPKTSSHSWLAIERNIIRNQLWQENPETGERDRLMHHMRHLRLLMPWVVHDPNLVRVMRIALECEDRQKRLLHMMGHASSGKTNFMVLDAFRNIDLWPENSEMFVASPYRSSSEYLLWNTFITYQEALKKVHGVYVETKKDVISFTKGRWAGPGTIRLVSFHAVAVLRGKKINARKPGVLGIYLDEAGEFPNDNILHIIANLRSQRGLRVRTGTNFRKLTGLDGKFNQPEEIPWTSLDREKHYEWDSVNKGHTIRMRALKSPNIVMKEDYYPYLLMNAEHDELLSYGVDSPHYLSQGDAFPSVHSVSRLIITAPDIEGGRALVDEPLTGRIQKFAFADPSFSEHGDEMVVCSAQLGKDVQGRDRIEIINEQGLPIRDAAVWDTERLALAERLRKGRPLKENQKYGEPVSPYDQAALQVGQYLLDMQIPFENFAYDDSMRGKITESMIFFLGDGTESVRYGDPATNKMSFPPVYRWSVRDSNSKQRTKVRVRACDIYANVAAQMWLGAASIIRAGYIRGAGRASKGLEQLALRLKAAPRESKRGVVERAEKEAIESKKEFREHNRNLSPDYADALCGVIWLIVDRKLAPVTDASPMSIHGGMNTVAHLRESMSRKKPRMGLSRRV